MGKIIIRGDLLSASVVQAALDAAKEHDHELIVCGGISRETILDEHMLDNLSMLVSGFEEFEDLNTLVVEPNTKTRGKHKQPFYNKGRW